MHVKLLSGTNLCLAIALAIDRFVECAEETVLMLEQNRVKLRQTV